MVNYMTIVESMPTYGVHYFEVLDKRGQVWWLGLSCRGIAQYEAHDRKSPVRVFQWKQLENLYFRDKKFSIEVHDAKRVIQTVSSFNLYDDMKSDDLSEAISEATTQVIFFFNSDIIYCRQLFLLYLVQFDFPSN